MSRRCAKAPKAPTIADWQNALNVAITKPVAVGGMTAEELADLMSCSRSTANTRIRNLVKSGVLGVTTKRTISIVGGSKVTPIYFLVQK